MIVSEFPDGVFYDRFDKEPHLGAIDVALPTLDAAFYLEKSLFTIYREIPVRKLIVCDGGSKDGTVEILNKFPRVELHHRPDIRTGGKYIEFLISLVGTDWFALIDGDRTLAPGWYDEMIKHKSEYDVIENSRTINAWHKYIEAKEQLKANVRSKALCHLAKRKAMKNWKSDDDYMARQLDMMVRYVPEKNGFRYGKVDSTLNIHNETERQPYSSEKNTSKSWRQIELPEPKMVILDKKKQKLDFIKNVKGTVKYLDPDFVCVKNDIVIDFNLRYLDRKWIKETNPAWLPRYDRSKSFSYAIKFLIYKYLISKNKKLKKLALKFYKTDLQ